MHTVLGFLVRLVLLATGLVFAAGLALVFLFLFLVAGVHAGWARLRGRPVAPFVFRVDPRAGFERFYRPGQRGGTAERDTGQARSSSPLARGPRALDARAGGVSDVEPRPPGERAE